MTRRRRIMVGILLCVSVAAFTVATFYGRSAMSVASGAVCMLALAWSFILVSERKGSP